MTTDPGNGQARTSDTFPRQRVGAHAATKTSRFRRKSVSGPAPLAGRRPGTEAGDRVQPRVDGSGGLPGPVPWARDPITVPLPAVAPPQPRPPQPGRRSPAAAAPAAAAAARSAAASLCALAVVATVVPLAAIQIPDAIAWSLPPRLAAGGPAVVTSLLRASGLALPAMAVTGSLAALAVRWLRAGPVLLTGLVLLAAADALGDTARTVALIGADRSLHGAGAGIAMTGVVAVVAERQPRRRQRHQPGSREGRPAAARLVLPGWWAAFTVAGLAAAPELMRYRVSSGGWPAALQPYPWLTRGGARFRRAVRAAGRGYRRDDGQEFLPGGRTGSADPAHGAGGGHLRDRRGRHVPRGSGPDRGRRGRRGRAGRPRPPSRPGQAAAPASPWSAP